MCGRTTTSSIGRTGSSSDFGVAIFRRTFTQEMEFQILASIHLPRQGEVGAQRRVGGGGVGLDPGHAPRGRPAPRHRVDDDGRQEHKAGHDVLPLNIRDPLQIQAVVYPGDHQPAGAVSLATTVWSSAAVSPDKVLVCPLAIAEEPATGSNMYEEP